MKTLLVFFALMNVAQAAPLCEVYGISDSPQALSCSIGGKKTELTCKEGVYQLNGSAVEAAFHYEVEEGPVPLVFRTSSEELTVTLGSGRSHKATLVSGRRKSQGNCRQ